jgi:hypothetical protein
MARRLSRALLFVVAWSASVASAPACSLLLDSDGFSGGAPDAFAGDAQVEAAADSAGDAPRDAPVDAGTDADLRPFCEIALETAQFCDDFEREDLLGAWSQPPLTAGATVALVKADDGNTYVRASVPETADFARAAIQHEFQARPTRIARFAFDVRVPALPATGAANTMVLILDDEGQRRVVALWVRDVGVQIFEQHIDTDLFFAYPLDRPVSVGRWHRVELEVRLDTSPSSFVVRVDGEVALNRPSQVGLAPGRLIVSAGVTYAGPRPALAVELDRAVVTYE